MPISRAQYDATFGTGWHPKGATIRKYLTYTTYAGDPTSNLDPEFIGQFCLDTSNDVFYVAPTLDSGDWAAIHS